MRQWCIVRNGRWSTVDGRKYAELNGGGFKVMKGLSPSMGQFLMYIYHMKLNNARIMMTTVRAIISK